MAIVPQGRKPRLGIDIDNVVVRTDIHWNCWLMEKSGYKDSRLPTEGIISHDLSIYYPEVKKPFDFWRQEGLYDNAIPCSGSKYYIEKLKEHFDIVFVTAIKGNHHKSKYYFIDKYFPYMDSFVATKEKYVVDLDIMVDDRVNNLDKFSPSVYKILFETKYQQYREHDYRPSSGWKEVYSRCMTYLETKDCILNSVPVLGV